MIPNWFTISMHIMDNADGWQYIFATFRSLIYGVEINFHVSKTIIELKMEKISNIL